MTAVVRVPVLSLSNLVIVTKLVLMLQLVQVVLVLPEVVMPLSLVVLVHLVET